MLQTTQQSNAKQFEQFNYITPAKPRNNNIEFYTPFTPNQQNQQQHKQLYTARKNLSASKFYFDEHICQDPIEQSRIDDATNKIELACQSASFEYNQFSLVTQDVIKLLFIFPEMKMLCTYPIESPVQFLNVSQQCYPNDISLVLSSQPIKSLPKINDILQIRSIRSGLVNLTYNQLYRRDSETILETLQSVNVKQIFYLDDVECLKYLICSDYIPHHVVCYHGVLPVSNSKDLKNILQIRTDYLGPRLELGLKQEGEFQPNYYLKKVVFLDSEQPSKIISRLNQQNLQSIAFKFKNQNNLNSFEDQCCSQQLYYSNYSLLSNMFNVNQDINLLVHVDQVYSLQEYLNDCASLPKTCVSLVYLSKEQYLARRKSLYFQQTEMDLLQQICEYLTHKQSKCTHKELKTMFSIDNISKVLTIMEKHGLIVIEYTLPQKCEVTIDGAVDTNSQSVNQLIKVIKLHSRKIISLRKDHQSLKHYQINLQDICLHMNKSLVDLVLQIDNMNTIFRDPQFSDFMIAYQMGSSTNLLQASQEICQIRRRQIEELDIFYCLGQMLKSKAVNECNNFHSNQIKFAEIVDKYFASETQLSIGQLFNHNHEKYLPLKSIDGIRERAQIQQDIRKLNKQQTARNMLMQLMKQYDDYDPKQLWDLIELYTQQHQNKLTRVNGWMLNRKKVKL